MHSTELAIANTGHDLMNSSPKGSLLSVWSTRQAWGVTGNSQLSEEVHDSVWGKVRFMFDLDTNFDTFNC